MPFHSDIVFDPSNSIAVIAAGIAFAIMAGRQAMKRKPVKSAAADW